MHEYPLPGWAKERSNGEYMKIGSQLCTKDGRKIGNAFVIKIKKYNNLIVAEVKTDIGTVLELTEQELKQYFYQPQYIMKTGDEK